MLAQSGGKLTRRVSGRGVTAHRLCATPASVAIGFAPQFSGTLWHRHRTHVLRHLVTLLNCRTHRDGFVPAFHVWILLHVNGLPFEARDPRPDRNVGNGILIDDELAP